MSIVERILDLGQSAVVAIAAGVVGGLTWVIRNILTNQRQIELTQQKLNGLSDGLNRIETILINKSLGGKE